MKKLSLALFLMMLSLSVSAQTTIKGIVIDSISHEPEPFATVRLFKESKTDTPQSVSVTDVNGNIKHVTKGKGTFILRISAIGRKDIVRTINIDDKPIINLDTLYIRNDEKTLADVKVVAQKPIVKMEVDKMTYDVQADVDSKSNTVLDMLRKVPMVNVDGQDNITVNGSGNFKVYVNGKPNVMMSNNPSQVFKVMPAAGIKNIEVITHPGAKYDAEGVGGVLNLIMDTKSAAGKASTNNKTLTTRLNGGTRNYGASIYGAMQEGKFSMSMNYSNSNGLNQKQYSDIDREQFGSTSPSTLSSHSETKSRYHFNMAELTAGYEIDSLRLLSVNFGLWGFSTKNNGTTLSNFSKSAADTPFSYTTASNTRMSSISYDGGLDYQRSFKSNKDRMLTLSYRISTNPVRDRTLSDMTSEGKQEWLNLTDRYTDSHTNIIEQTFQTDYTTPIGKMFTVDAGMKFISRNNKSKSEYYTVKDDVYTPQTSADMNYRHLNDILAGYTQATLKLKKMSFKTGLRYEHTWQKVKYIEGIGENFNLDYGNLVPSADFSFTLNEKMNTGITYSMRIHRPGISMLNPYIDRSDPTSLSYGNTNLDAEKSHTINGVFNYFTSKFMLNLNASVNFCNNAFSSYSFYDNDGLLNTTYGNIGKNKSFSLNSYINWSMTTTTRITMNMSGGYNDMRSDALGYHNYGFSGNAFVGVQQQLPANMRVSINTFASSKEYSLMGESSGFCGIMGSINKTFLNKKLDVSISGFTPFTGKYGKFNSTTRAKDYTSHMKFRVPIANLRLSVSYTIGGNVDVKKARRTIQNDDVKNVENNQQQQTGNNMGQ
jgi:outer membrane receptor protein involved in Fe transport